MSGRGINLDAEGKINSSSKDITIVRVDSNDDRIDIDK